MTPKEKKEHSELLRVLFFVYLKSMENLPINYSCSCASLLDRDNGESTD